MFAGKFFKDYMPVLWSRSTWVPQSFSMHSNPICVTGYEERSICTCADSLSPETGPCSVALQLLSVGLFPCAPKRPTLAVDLDLLDFARLLFRNIAPNMTGLTCAIEEFLMARQQQLGTVVRVYIYWAYLTGPNIPIARTPRALFQSIVLVQLSQR